MSDAAPPISPDPSPTRSGRLLALVRKLIDYARELAETVRQRVATDPVFAKTSFGTADLAVIFRRITRGVLLANALEARVLGRASSLDKGPRPRQSRTERRPSVPPPAEPVATDASPARVPAPDPEGWPTAEQIAAEIRRRPIGAVIADICLHLGILPSHPLWREVRHAIMEHGGNYTRLVMGLLDLAFPLDPARLPPELRPALRGYGQRFRPPSGAGPP